VRFQFLKFYFWNIGLELTNGENGQSAGANVIDWSKKSNIRANIKPKKIAEPLLNTPFNNVSKHIIIVKGSI
jgi:hypothetical protein